MRDILSTTFADFYISIFPEVWKFWKCANLKFVEILNVKITFLSKQKV